jgi:hypothetical protein
MKKKTGLAIRSQPGLSIDARHRLSWLPQLDMRVDCIASMYIPILVSLAHTLISKRTAPLYCVYQPDIQGWSRAESAAGLGIMRTYKRAQSLAKSRVDICLKSFGHNNMFASRFALALSFSFNKFSLING